jgi:nicotinate-nucleotide adenylyltransferase
VQRIGLVGGTFDPVHNGHLLLALFARETIPLDEIIFIPAADPPHKDGTRASATARLAMVEYAIEGLDHFSASRIELDRPGKSYTVETLRQLHAQRSEGDFYLIIGADNVAQMSTWHDPEGILDLCTVVAGTRLAAEAHVDPALVSRMRFIDTPLIELSSTQIRQRLHDSLPVRAMVPEKVERYIHEKGLYTPCI